MSIDNANCRGAGDFYLNATELTAGLTINDISRTTGSTSGEGFLIAFFTSELDTSPIYWQTSDGNPLTMSSVEVTSRFPPQT